uniref:Cpn10 n=1 Tax=Stygiella incarcerata TaxID=1712417 RepID=A0A192ZIZ9_9EUKA|nr:Cpn10 [Stygiella incarcerata]
MSLLRSFAHVASIPSHSFGRFFTATIKRFRPLGDRVLVEKVEPKKKSVGGILLPDSAVPRANEGKVLEVGAGARTRDGQVVPMNVKPGDRVLLPEFGGLGVKFGDKEYFLYRDEDILGILIE